MSRKKLFEMMNKVNKTTLNENIENDILNNYYQELLNNTLNIENTSTRLEDNITYVTLNASEEDSNIEFVFKVIVSDDAQSDVFEVDSVELKSFKSQSPTEGDIDLYDDMLSDFNKQHNSGMFDLISKYVDVESEIENDDETEEDIYESAINIIENIRTDKYRLKQDELKPDKILFNVFNSLPMDKKLELARIVNNKMVNNKHYSELSNEEFYKEAADILYNSFKSHLEMQNESKK